MALRDKESDEITLILRRVDMLHKDIPQLNIGDIVRWIYEWSGDPEYGFLYIVMGYNSEKPDIIVTRMMSRPYEVREFHISQLAKV